MMGSLIILRLLMKPIFKIYFYRKEKLTADLIEIKNGIVDYNSSKKKNPSRLNSLFRTGLS